LAPDARSSSARWGEEAARALYELGLIGLIDARTLCVRVASPLKAVEAPVERLRAEGLEMGRVREADLEFVGFPLGVGALMVHRSWVCRRSLVCHLRSRGGSISRRAFAALTTDVQSRGVSLAITVRFFVCVYEAERGAVGVQHLYTVAEGYRHLGLASICLAEAASVLHELQWPFEIEAEYYERNSGAAGLFDRLGWTKLERVGWFMVQL
jgi:GNAT superfamily N-acetyltransferase